MSLFVGPQTRARTPGGRRDFAGPWGPFGPYADGRTVPTPGQDYELSNSLVRGLQVAAVVACVGLRSGAIAQCPLDGYERRGGVAQLVDPQPAIYEDPGGPVVEPVWKIQMSISRDIWGWALGRITAFDAAMYPTRVDWIDPTMVHPRSLPGNEIQWRVAGQVVDSSMYVHVPSRWVLPGQPWGISPLEYSGLVDMARTAQNFGRDWFRNGAVPSAIVYSDDPKLTQQQATNMVDRLMERWRYRRPGVLSKLFKYEKVAVAPNESQFIETCTKIAADIASSYNLPPVRIGAAIAGQNVTYQNIGDNQQQVLVDSVNPDLRVIEKALDRHTRPGIFCRFDTEAFLRADIKTRYEVGEIGVRARLVRPNEWRSKENLPPIPGGDEFPATAPTPPSPR